MAKEYLSIDVGGTNIKYGLLNAAGKIIEHGETTTPTEDLDIFLDVVYKIIEKYLGRIRGVAFSVPGKVDVSKGIVYLGGSLPFLDGICLKDVVNKKHPKLMVSVVNDGKAAAMAEMWLGNLKNIDNGAAIVLGTGVGGGIVVNNRLLQGTNFQAGELSFMLNDITATGFKGMVGMNCSAVEMIEDIATALSLANKKDGRKAFELIKNGNVVAKSIFEEYCRKVALLILNVQTVVDLRRYVLGGGISAQPIVTREINRQYELYLSNNSLVDKTLKKPEIVKAKFENEANLYGALYGLLLKVDEEKIYS